MTKNVLADEIIWATSTTGEDFQCVHADFAREQQAEIERLRALLREVLEQGELSREQWSRIRAAVEPEKPK